MIAALRRRVGELREGASASGADPNAASASGTIWKPPRKACAPRNSERVRRPRTGARRATPRVAVEIAAAKGVGLRRRARDAKAAEEEETSTRWRRRGCGGGGGGGGARGGAGGDGRRAGGDRRRAGGDRRRAGGDRRRAGGDRRAPERRRAAASLGEGGASAAQQQRKEAKRDKREKKREKRRGGKRDADAEEAPEEAPEEAAEEAPEVSGRRSSRSAPSPQNLTLDRTRVARRPSWRATPPPPPPPRRRARRLAVPSPRPACLPTTRNLRARAPRQPPRSPPKTPYVDSREDVEMHGERAADPLPAHPWGTPAGPCSNSPPRNGRGARRAQTEADDDGRGGRVASRALMVDPETMDGETAGGGGGAARRVGAVRGRGCGAAGADGGWRDAREPGRAAPRRRARGARSDVSHHRRCRGRRRWTLGGGGGRGRVGEIRGRAPAGRGRRGRGVSGGVVGPMKKRTRSELWCGGSD